MAYPPREVFSPIRVLQHRPPYLHPLNFPDVPFSKSNKFFNKTSQDGQRQMIFLHRQPLFIQDPIIPKLPPPNFTIPDIASSNSVYGEEDHNASKDRTVSFYECLPLPPSQSPEALESTTPESHEDSSVDAMQPPQQPTPPAPKTQVTNFLF